MTSGNSPIGGATDAIQRGWREVLVLRLLRIPSGTAVHRRNPRTWGPWGLWSFGPPLALVLPSLVAPDSWVPYYSQSQLWAIALFCLINAGTFAAASLAWGYCEDSVRSARIEELLAKPGLSVHAAAPVIWALPAKRQAVLPALLALLPPAAMLADVARHGPQPISQWIVAWCAAWTLALVGNDIWWLAVTPLVVWRMAGRRLDLTLRWHDPARTPGIRLLAEGYVFAALFLALAGVAVVLLGLIDNFLTRPVLVALFIPLLAVTIWVGAVTQLLLYYIVRQARLKALDRLAGPWTVQRPLQAPRVVGLQDHAELADSLTAYFAVGSASNLPYGSAIVLQYLVAVFGSVVGFLLQVFLEPPT